jgi:hypothetical protein
MGQGSHSEAARLGQEIVAGHAPRQPASSADGRERVCAPLMRCMRLLWQHP